MSSLRVHLLPAFLVALPACGTDGPQGFFVELSGLVVNEYGSPAAGLSVTFAIETSELVGVATTDAEGRYSLPVYGEELTGHALRVLLEGAGYAPVEANLEVNLRDIYTDELEAHPTQTWTSWKWVLPPMSIAYTGETGRLEGILLDATDGTPLPQDDLEPGTILVLEGYNASEGAEPVGEFLWGMGGQGPGQFLIEDIPPGTYTAFIPDVASYTAARFPILVPAEAERSVRIAMSRPLASDEMRVALTWGDSPADENLHLTGPKSTESSTETDRFHVWADYPNHPSDPPPGTDYVVTMEREDGDGGGPESILVSDVRTSGEYRFSVFDASNATTEGSTALSDSQAVIQVWVGDEVPRFFEVTPGSTEGNAWRAGAVDRETSLWYTFQEMADLDDEAADIEF